MIKKNIKKHHFIDIFEFPLQLGFVSPTIVGGNSITFTTTTGTLATDINYVFNNNNSEIRANHTPQTGGVRYVNNTLEFFDGVVWQQINLSSQNVV